MDSCRDFNALWRRIHASGDPNPFYARLQELYAQPHRAYHNLQHIVACLNELQPALPLCEHPDEVQYALWFHDAIYDPKAKDNEVQSARLASEVAAGAVLPPAFIRRVNELILATRHNVPPEGRDAQIMVDVDLSILGKPAAEFTAYEQAIRHEYAWVPEPAFKQGRGAILRSFLDRLKLFNTPFFYEKYELSARKNLQHSIEILSQK